MNHITVSQLRTESGKVWNRVAGGEELVITRNGKPLALLLRADPAEVEVALRAYRAARLGMALDRIQTFAEVQGLDKLTDQEIGAEIDAVRKQRRGASAVPVRR